MPGRPLRGRAVLRAALHVVLVPCSGEGVMGSLNRSRANAFRTTHRDRVGGKVRAPRKRSKVNSPNRQRIVRVLLAKNLALSWTDLCVLR